MAKPKFDFNAVSGLGTKDSPLMYQGKRYTGTVQWSTGPAKYVNGVKLTATTDTTIVPDGGAEVSTTAIPEPGVTVAGTAEVGPTGPTGPTGDTATGPTASVADTVKKFGIIEALLFDPKYGKPNQKGGLWEVFDVDTNQKNPGKAADLWVNTDWYKLNDNAKERYLLSLEKQPVYQEQRNAWLIRIKKLLNTKNIKVDDATLFDYYDKGTEDTVIEDELITKQFPTGATGATTATGPVGSFGFDTRRQLAQVAKDNGLDLDKDFGGQINDWLQRIARGENINIFFDVIRKKAGENKPKFVQDQLSLGNNLRSIYATYIAEMAAAFDIPQDAIDINDPLLQKAISSSGQMKKNDFSVLISQDPRYKGTPSAASEESLRKQIQDRAIAIGASSIKDADIDAILKTLLATGLTSFGPSTIDAELRKFITYTPGGTGPVTGAAGDALSILRKTAADNGLDLDKVFGSSIEEWLRKINQGESIETYKRTIRSTAANGLPDNIKKLIAEGVDLMAIYSPYRELMSKVLEINPESISLNDPTLRSAIGQDKEMSLYEYQRALRKDPRWQYTNNARREVSDYTLQVLRDFGFQG